MRGFINDEETAMKNSPNKISGKRRFRARPPVLRGRDGRVILRYTRPSFLEGMARVLDMGGTLSRPDTSYLDDLRAGRIPHTSQKDDAEAIRGYWVEVGNYIRNAMGRIEAEGLSETKSARSDE